MCLLFNFSRKPRELSCDLFSNQLSQSDEVILQKLVSSVSDDTLAFIKAKEEFKKALTFPGVLYRYTYVIHENLMALST